MTRGCPRRSSTTRSTLPGNRASPSCASSQQVPEEASITAFHAAFAGRGVIASHLSLFDKPNVSDVADHLLSQDVIWVDRGSVVNLLAVWRSHRLDQIMRRCWEQGSSSGRWDPLVHGE
ncbi:Type 1 glutamine amidotransferase-like domain-containing protein [Nocardia sp. CA-129566]|uniref:Type 1 glutamine amidotransferase-like domain-containing protein n=1 Tax=Nocardia sp. CA-129566 TaxID=3239976 RepID=UPI003D9812C6